MTYAIITLKTTLNERFLMNKDNSSPTKPLEEVEQSLKKMHHLGLQAEAQALLDDALQSLEDAKQEQAHFVSIVSHELRIPMTSIMGYTDLLKQGAMGEINPNQLNFLNVIRENVGRMSKLISDLSDIYKIESGRMHLEPETMSVFNAIQSGVELAQKTLNGQNPEIEVVVAAALPLVQADSKRVSQMVQYLLKNSFLYSEEGQPVTVKALREDEYIRLLVADQGIGIQLEDQPYIFTQFFRSEVEEVREHKGWGLSLCVVKNLAELSGGKAGYETKPGAGSTFWFTIPVG
jgi:signal transduction histidine kinase